jgi:C-terminal processing protease CtpA/Prc
MFHPYHVQDWNISSIKELQLTHFADGNMFIHFIEPHYLKAHKDKDDKKPDIRGRIEEAERADYSFGTITFDSDSVPGKTIATLPITDFVQSIEKFWGPWKEVQAVISQKLSSIADADALIVDLRQNHGGQPETVGFMLSYLLDGGPRHVLDFVDRHGTIEKSISTLAIDELPASTKPFGGTKPLYVLTTENTVSSGEDMAYTLQALKRAIAVIGEGNEKTKGAANNITKPHHLCEEEFGEKWWTASMPNTKPVNPITGTNWEGVGVKSDIVAGMGEWEGVEDAKEVATRLAVKILGQGEDES